MKNGRGVLIYHEEEYVKELQTTNEAAKYLGLTANQIRSLVSSTTRNPDKPGLRLFRVDKEMDMEEKCKICVHRKPCEVWWSTFVAILKHNGLTVEHKGECIYWEVKDESDREVES